MYITRVFVLSCEEIIYNALIGQFAMRSSEIIITTSLIFLALSSTSHTNNTSILYQFVRRTAGKKGALPTLPTLFLVSFQHFHEFTRLSTDVTHCAIRCVHHTPQNKILLCLTNNFIMCNRAMVMVIFVIFFILTANLCRHIGTTQVVIYFLNIFIVYSTTPIQFFF